MNIFILDVNIKYIVFSIKFLYRHINVPMAFKELKINLGQPLQTI